MTHLKRLSICTIALFAIAAFTAPLASAKSTLPEWGGCVVFQGSPATETEPARGPGEGKYGNATCTDPVKPLNKKPAGDWEWYPFEQYLKLTEEGAYSFEEGAIGPTTFETTNGKAIHCSTGELQYEGVESSKTVGEVLSVFYGCESEGEPCSGKFQSEGKISDIAAWLEGEGLKGELVSLAGKGTASPTVGLSLTSFKAGAPLFTVVCEGALGSVEIGGAGAKKTEKAKGNAAVAVIAPVDQMTTEFTQTFAQSAGVQEPAPEKGKAKSLQMFLGNEDKWVQMGLASTFTAISESGRPPIEIKAIK